MDCIIFSFSTSVGNISIREGKFFVVILDEFKVDPFLSKSIKATAKYLCDIFENSYTNIEFKYNYNALKTTPKKEEKIQNLLKQSPHINISYIMNWLVMLL
jgi:hypothetical protein